MFNYLNLTLCTEKFLSKLGVSSWGVLGDSMVEDTRDCQIAAQSCGSNRCGFIMCIKQETGMTG